MYHAILGSVAFYTALFKIDGELCQRARLARCPWCGGTLHRADFWRHPRGGPAGLPPDLHWRHGLCCGREGCRRRVLPPSCLYLGRKVYWGAVVLLSVLARERRVEGFTARKLREMYGICRDTLLRWRAFFHTELPASRWWRSVRGRLGAEVRDADLPGSLFDHFRRGAASDEDTLKACLGFLADARAGPAG